MQPLPKSSVSDNKEFKTLKNQYNYENNDHYNRNDHNDHDYIDGDGEDDVEDEEDDNDGDYNVSRSTEFNTVVDYQNSCVRKRINQTSKNKTADDYEYLPFSKYSSERTLMTKAIIKKPQQFVNFVTHSNAKLKKIVFNGTYPIDDPYSSRFQRSKD